MDREAFEAEGDRLVELARAEGLTLRILGALAFARRCPGHRRLQDTLGRHYTDIDFAAYGRKHFERYLRQLSDPRVPAWMEHVRG